MTFGKLITTYKEKHNLSDSQIAEIVGDTTRVTVNNICNDKHLPNIELALKLVLFFKIKIEEVTKALCLSNILIEHYQLAMMEEDAQAYALKMKNNNSHLKKRINCLELELTAMDYDWEEADYPPGDFTT